MYKPMKTWDARAGGGDSYYSSFAVNAITVQNTVTVEKFGTLGVDPHGIDFISLDDHGIFLARHIYRSREIPRKRPVHPCFE